MDHKRILFIYHHHISFYGAYKSSVSLFLNLDDYIVDIVYQETHENSWGGETKKFFDLQDEETLQKTSKAKYRRSYIYPCLGTGGAIQWAIILPKEKAYTIICKFLSLMIAWLKFYVFCNDYDIIHLSSGLHLRLGI